MTLDIPAASAPVADALPRFSLARSLKLGSFHIGSSLTDTLTSAVVNRVLIVEMGIAAWPISLLVALRYILLSPFGLWVSYLSDTRPIRNSRRVSYIWIGRGLMLISLPLLVLAIGDIARHTGSISGWGLAIFSFLVYGLGTLISGGPFLALVQDSVPYTRRGQAIAVVQTILVASFAFVGILYGSLLPEWDYGRFAQLVLVALIGAAFFWLISVWREERPVVLPPAAERPSYRHTFAGMLADQRLRRYAIFLGVSAFFAFMFDLVLEPFGGDVFGLAVGETTRFGAYWGSGVLLAMIVTAYRTRRWPPHQQVRTTIWGLALLGATILLLALTSWLALEALLRPALILFGVGFGIYTVGGVALLMAMSREAQAASFLALWSTIQLVFRGFGLATGGVLRDLALWLTADFTRTYAIVFAVEGMGLLLCIHLLRRVDVRGFAHDRQRDHAAELLALAD